LKDNPDVELKQVVYGEWNQERTKKQTIGMLKRYSDIKIIWAANDPMAMGVLDALEFMGKKAGKDVFVGGLNWSSPALSEVKNGKMVTTVGGHFMCGGWSLVLLYDYHNRLDFKRAEGTEVKVNVFGAIDKYNVDNYLKYLGDQNWNKIDFKKFSKIENESLENYEFGLEPILRQFD